MNYSVKRLQSQFSFADYEDKLNGQNFKEPGENHLSVCDYELSFGDQDLESDMEFWARICGHENLRWVEQIMVFCK